MFNCVLDLKDISSTLLLNVSFLTHFSKGKQSQQKHRETEYSLNPCWPWEMSQLPSSQITQGALLHKAPSVYLDPKCRLFFPLWAFVLPHLPRHIAFRGVSLYNPHARVWVMLREAQMVKESQPVPKRRVTSNTSPPDLRCLLSLRCGPLWSVWKGRAPGPRHAVSSSLT